MSHINKHLSQKEDQLKSLETTLQQMQEQLNLLQQEIRIQNQIHKAQSTIVKEFDSQKKALTKLLKDACSCFEIDALNDFVEDIKDIAEQVINDYESHSQSDRFLAGDIEDSVAHGEEPNHQEPQLDVKTLDLETYLAQMSPDTLETIKQTFKLTRIKTISRIAQHLRSKNLTVENLENILTNLAPPLLTNNSIAVLNGKN